MTLLQRWASTDLARQLAQTQASRNSWSRLAHRLGDKCRLQAAEITRLRGVIDSIFEPDAKRPEGLRHADEVRHLRAQIVQLTAERDRARLVQMADYSTGRVPL